MEVIGSNNLNNINRSQKGSEFSAIHSTVVSITPVSQTPATMELAF